MATTPADVFGTAPPPQVPNALDAALMGQSIFGPPPNTEGAEAPPMLPGVNSPPNSSSQSYVRDPAAPQLDTQHAEAAIQKLRPGSEAHRFVYSRLEAMLKFSRDEMRKHYSRWNFAEMKVQAYTQANDYDQLMDSLAATGTSASQGGTIPEPVSVVVPYSYATIHAAATFVASVLLSRKPVFPLLATRGTETDRARNMELAIQSGLDASRGQETLWQLIWDSFIYSFGVCRNGWEQREGPAIRWIDGNRTITNETTFAGNVLSAIDPYAFFPDPRVPIHLCNLRGDFMFTQMQQSETVLRDMEGEGKLFWVEEAIRLNKNLSLYDDRAVVENRRRMKIGIRGEYLTTPSNVAGFHNVYEGTVRLCPKHWKLGDSERSELWKFVWMRGQIIQAEPLGMAHGMHPYVVSEPTSFGHDFMSLSMHDMIGPFQDILSWLVSSRMENVRVAINNMFVADPARVEVNDIRSSPIGRIIRLKQAAMGLPVKEAIMQLLVQDVTGGHISDIQTMRILADTITGVNDNMRGINTSGGRRSATEARQSMQAGAARLSQHSIRISGQAFQPLATQQILNIQQFMPQKMWVEVTGDDQMPSSQQMTPDMLVGSFNYQVSDGSLPFDKQALVEVWKEILFGVAQDPQLRAEWSISKIFRYVADLGGARNIDSFKNAMQPQLPGQMGNPFVAGASADPGSQPGMVPVAPAMPARPMFQQ